MSHWTPTLPFAVAKPRPAVSVVKAALVVVINLGYASLPA